MPHTFQLRRVPGIEPKAARAVWTAALVLLLLGAIYAVRGTLFMFVVAMLFAYLLYPLVNLISSRFPVRSRGTALACTYLLVLGILGVLIAVIGSKVAEEARLFAAHPPDVKAFLRNLKTEHPAFSPVIDAAQSRVGDVTGEIFSAVPRFSMHVLSVSANLLNIILIPILSFFMLKDGARMRSSFLARVPAGPKRENAESVLAAIDTVLLNYMRALLMLCFCVLLVFSVVLSAMGVEYGLLLASIAFLCEFVPLLGPLTAAAIIVLVNLLSGYPHILWLLFFLGAFRLMQDYFISPRLMGHGVELHPLLVIFGVFAGAEIAGVAGVFLSVPVLALCRLVFEGTANRRE